MNSFEPQDLEEFYPTLKIAVETYLRIYPWRKSEAGKYKFENLNKKKCNVFYKYYKNNFLKMYVKSFNDEEKAFNFWMRILDKIFYQKLENGHAFIIYTSKSKHHKKLRRKGE